MNCHFQCSRYSDVVKFTTSPAGHAPYVTEPLSDAVGERGRSLTLKCTITGDPQPEYHWYKGLRELADTPKYNINVRGDSQVIYMDYIWYFKGSIINDYRASDNKLFLTFILICFQYKMKLKSYNK